LIDTPFIKSSDPILCAKSLIGVLENSVFPLDVEGIALSVGIREIRQLDDEGIEGILVANPEKTKGYISIASSIREHTRKRFTIAHELGHFLITTHGSQFYCTSFDLNNFYNNNQIMEVEANQFAAELLTPGKYFAKEIYNKAPSYDLIQSLTVKFCSSLTSTLLRYKDLTDESIAIVMSENSIIKWASRSGEFKYFIPSLTRLSPDSYAIEYFKGNDLPIEFNEVEKDTWFDTAAIKHHLVVRELSIPLPFYRQVLSVIWLYEDEDEIEYYEDEFDGYLKRKENW
jgi:Zn-dependent peptidase ImmA (M78 family)